MKESILVAGGSGFVGRNLTIALAKANFNVLASRHQQAIYGIESTLYKKYDFTLLADCLEATRNKEICIISTGISHGATYRQQFPSASLAPVSAMFHNLLEACARNNVPRIIIFSTATIYQPSQSPLAEHELDLRAPPHPAYAGIGAQFRYFEELARYYKKIYEMNLCILRISSLFGPFDKFDGTGALLPTLISRFITESQLIDIKCSPMLTRDFLYIKDFCNDLVKLIENNSISGVFNMGNGNPNTIQEVVDALLEIIPESSAQFILDTNNTPDSRCISTGKLEAALGALNRTPMIEALSDTVNWHVQHFPAKLKPNNKRVIL